MEKWKEFEERLLHLKRQELKGGVQDRMSRKGNNTGQQNKRKGTVLLHCSVPMEVSTALLPSK